MRDQYDLKRVDGEILVTYGKFSALLRELDRTGELVSKSGRVHTVPAWQIQHLLTAAQMMEPA